MSRPMRASRPVRGGRRGEVREEPGVFEGALSLGPRSREVALAFVRPARARRGRAALAVAVVVGWAVLAGRDPLVRAETRPHYGGTLEAALLGAPGSFDPVAARTHAEVTAVGLVYDTLYLIAPDGTTQPALALDVPAATPDPAVVRIAIRKGVQFQDGAPVTPQDVAASLERARAADRWLLAPVASVTADADAVVLTLRAPAADLAVLLALPQTAVTEGGKPPGAHPIGSGPFRVDVLDPVHHRLELRAFDGYFAGRPYVDRLVLRWYADGDAEPRRFETGAAQLSARGPTVFAGATPAYAARHVKSVPAILAFVGFGRRHRAVTGDLAFRRALDLALARGGLATIGAGELVVPTRSPSFPHAGRDAMDLAAARAQLAEAAARIGDLARVRLEILVEDTRPDDHDIAGRIVLALDKLGIAARIAAVPATTLRARVARGECDLWIGQLALPLAAPRAWWGAAFAAGGDASIQPLLAAGTFDAAAAARQFDERRPIVPLMFRAVSLWYRTDVHGVALDALARPDYADMFLFGKPRRGRP